MKRISSDAHDGQNYDSFLDIVANLVGILVILIMVIGVRARDAWDSQDEVSAKEPAATVAMIPPPANVVSKQEHAAIQSKVAIAVDSLEKAKSDAMGATREVHEMAATIEEIKKKAADEEQERNRLQLLVSLAEKSLEERQSHLAEGQQADLAIAKAIDLSRVELARLEEQAESIEANTGEPNVLEHRPTPIARTVFGSEEHWRLQDGRLAYVPINTMTAMLRRDAGNKIWKLGNSNQVSELIGPVDGFRMKYTLERRKKRVMTPEGARVGSVVELQRFVMVPDATNLGEPIDVALQPGSSFHFRMREYNPQDVTFTVWTYPESYAAFRKLKEYLTEKGYVVAARPLPAGYPIGGSPDGTKSAGE